jgi:hypothetical protein
MYDFNQMVTQTYNPISSKGGKRRTHKKRTTIKRRTIKKRTNRRHNNHSRTKRHR